MKQIKSDIAYVDEVAIVALLQVIEDGGFIQLAHLSHVLITIVSRRIAIQNIFNIHSYFL